MRVLEVVADGALGGGTTHVLQLLGGLRHAFEFGLATQPKSKAMAQGKDLGAEVFPVDLFSFSPIEIAKLRAACRAFQPDLVHLHGSRAAFWAGLLLPGTRRIYTVHGYHFLHRSQVLRRLGAAADRLVSARVEAVVFVSDHDRELARRHRLVPASVATTVIHNGIRVSGELPEHELGGGRVGFVGRMVFQKDPCLFLDTMALLEDHQAVMIGDGPLAEDIKSEIGRRDLTHVTYLGGLPHDRLLQRLSELDVLMMTSRWEGLPYIILEALDAGVPVVAPAVGGIPEMIRDGQGGFLVASRDPEDFARSVRKLTRSPETWRTAVMEGRARVRESFSEKAMLENVRDLYQELASKRAPDGASYLG